MRNEEERRSFGGNDDSAIELAKERIKSKKAKIAIAVISGMIILSIIVHFAS